MSEKTGITTRVYKEDLEWFENTFDFSGAKTWFFSTALRRFRELNEVDLDEAVDNAVREIQRTEE